MTLSEIDAWELASFGSITGESPICPHCGWVDRDAWELGLSDGNWTEHACGKCEQPFKVELSISYTYETSPLNTPSEES